MFSGGEAIQNWPEIGLILDIQDFDCNFKEIFLFSTYDSLCLTYLENKSLIWKKCPFHNNFTHSFPFHN